MTSYTESFGLVLVEAESYGIPILALDSAQGAKEIIQNGENGYLVANRNLNEMAEKIINLIEDENLRNSLGNQGRILSEKYKKENVANNWYELIDNIANHKA